MVVGALQSEEEQAGGAAAVEPRNSSHLSPLVPLVSQQTAHQPLHSTQDYNNHVSVGELFQFLFPNIVLTIRGYSCTVHRHLTDSELLFCTSRKHAAVSHCDHCTCRQLF